MTNSHSTDWLGLPSVFFNEKTNVASLNINDVIDFKNLEFDPDGLCNYLDYGYSVFGHTPIKHVKYLLPNSKLIIKNEKISITINDDPISKLMEGESTEEEVFNLLQKKVSKWEHENKNKTIIIPTSGGYDSRLLNTLIKNKRIIRSFSYGVSDDQLMSREVIYAEYVAKRLNIDWNFIPLTHINDYINAWYEIYGVSTHLHGMYQLEFYYKIHKTVPNGSVLSGIIGDAWAGNVNIPPITQPKDLSFLGYSHGIGADSKYCRLKSKNILASRYFKKNKSKLKDSRLRIIESMRLKSILLSYLLKIPNLYGYDSWSPFLDIEIATLMLKLPENKRKNRLWQKEYFDKIGLTPEYVNLKFDTKNTLDLQSLNQAIVAPLDKTILKEIINPKYIDSINHKIDKYYKYRNILKFIQIPLDLPLVNFIYHKVGFNNEFYGLNSDSYKAYSAYVTLKPLEMILKKREQL